MDWGLGHYERTAEKLVPAARAAVERAGVTARDRVVDVGCGTGNAALVAAERGARVTGVDPAPRLLDVARERARASGLEASFALGEAADLPLADGEADVVLSVFGVIFALDAPAAAREMARITATGGRIVLTAWIPEGAISESARIAREAVQAALGASTRPTPFPWHERDALCDLFAPHGFADVGLHEETLAFTAPSPSAYVEEEMANHPLSLAGRAVLEPRGEAQAVRDRTLEVLERWNEDPAGFRVTSRYVVAVCRAADRS